MAHYTPLLRTILDNSQMETMQDTRCTSLRLNEHLVQFQLQHPDNPGRGVHINIITDENGDIDSSISFNNWLPSWLLEEIREELVVAFENETTQNEVLSVSNEHTGENPIEPFDSPRTITAAGEDPTNPVVCWACETGQGNQQAHYGWCMANPDEEDYI